MRGKIRPEREKEGARKFEVFLVSSIPVQYSIEIQMQYWLLVAQGINFIYQEEEILCSGN